MTRLCQSALLAAASLAVSIAPMVATAQPGSPGVRAARDSANVRITQFTQRGVQAEPLLGLYPLIDIGGPRTPLLFSVPSAYLSADGGLVVLNAGMSQILYVDRTGRLVRSVGRAGQGPGEFTARGMIAWRCAADSLLVLDQLQNRYTLLDAAGDVVRVVRPQTFDGRRVTPLPSRAGRGFDDCTFLGFEHSNDPAASAQTPMFDRVDREGRPTAGIGPLRLQTPVRQVVHAVSSGAGGRGLSVTTRSAGVIRQISRSLNIAHGKSSFAVVDDRGPDVRVYSKSGTLQRIIRWDTPTIESRLRTGASSLAGAQPALGQPSTAQASSGPKTLGVFIDDQDRLWVEDIPTLGAIRRTWIVCSPTGDRLGTFWIPAEYSLSDVRGDRAVVMFGKDGDEHVAVLPVIAAGLLPPR